MDHGIEHFNIFFLEFLYEKNTVKPWQSIKIVSYRFQELITQMLLPNKNSHSQAPKVFPRVRIIDVIFDIRKKNFFVLQSSHLI